MTAVRVLDATLRDGSHPVRHQHTPEQVRTLAALLDAAGVAAIGVGHGEGLGASSRHFGHGAHRDAELLEAAAGAVERAKIAVTLVPGLGIKEDLHVAWECGARVARIATHCTEADIALQHIALARERGFVVHGDLMMPHLTTVAGLAEQATMMVDAGAHGVHVIDSAGTLTPPAVRERITAFLDAFGDRAEAGMHGHDNLTLAVANTVAAVEAGATIVDACVAGLGAGAGNCRTEALAAVLDRCGIENDLRLAPLQEAAAYVLAEMAPQPWPAQSGTALLLGYAGVPSSVLLHIERAAARFGVDASDIVAELGRRRTVSGQEDFVITVAARLAEQRPQAA
jgi:4-hydroxy 2-oxovalerate aldolase